MAASLFARIAELAGERLLSVSPDFVKLTPRELDIVNAIAAWLSHKEIALRLSIETQTIKNHIHNILDKLQLNTRLEAVEYARERNLLIQK
jgi:two-component system nitrate/nitrite response regulator NarL